MTTETQPGIRNDAERMSFGQARISVRGQEWPEGKGPGVWLQIDDASFLFTLDGAVRLANALQEQVDAVRLGPSGGEGKDAAG